jgi:hypothetical protein
MKPTLLFLLSLLMGTFKGVYNFAWEETLSLGSYCIYRLPKAFQLYAPLFSWGGMGE